MNDKPLNIPAGWRLLKPNERAKKGDKFLVFGCTDTWLSQNYMSGFQAKRLPPVIRKTNRNNNTRDVGKALRNRTKRLTGK